jgi:hypothetical protein
MTCNKETKRCPRSYSTQINPCCRGHIELIWSTILEVCAEHDITVFGDYGSLLGVAQRANGKGTGIVWNDKDGDGGILVKDMQKLTDLRYIFENRGFVFLKSMQRPGRYSGGNRYKIRLSEINEINVDLFVWYPQIAGLLDRTNYIYVDKFKGREFPEEWLFPLQYLDFENIKLPVPKEYIKLVEHRYTDNWMGDAPGNHLGIKYNKNAVINIRRLLGKHAISHKSILVVGDKNGATAEFLVRASRAKVGYINCKILKEYDRLEKGDSTKHYDMGVFFPGVDSSQYNCMIKFEVAELLEKYL